MSIILSCPGFCCEIKNECSRYLSIGKPNTRAGEFWRLRPKGGDCSAFISRFEEQPKNFGILSAMINNEGLKFSDDG
jgi:hypothetical protein